jgi:hypothetical protein
MKTIDYTASKVSNINYKLGIYDDTTRDFLNNTAFWFSQIDRTQSFNVGPKCKIIEPLPKGNETRTLEELCDIRARSLIAENKPIAVYWSGGIDSTLVLVSLLKAGVPFDQLTVVLSSFSIVEYKSFYNNHIKDKLNVRKVGPSIYPYIKTNELIVTGEHGDQVFGSDNAGLYKNDFDNLFTETWQEGFRRRVKSNKADEILEPLMKKAPFEIKNAFDGYWWYNITCKWQHVSLRMTSHMKDIPAFLSVVRHFFNTPEFQLWSMNEQNHRTLKIKNTWNSYKFEAKRLIREFDGNEDYEREKLKIGSLPTYIVKPFIFLFEDYTRITCDQDMKTMLDNFSETDFLETYGINYRELFT